MNPRTGGRRKTQWLAAPRKLLFLPQTNPQPRTGLRPRHRTLPKRCATWQKFPKSIRTCFANPRRVPCFQSRSMKWAIICARPEMHRGHRPSRPAAADGFRILRASGFEASSGNQIVRLLGQMELASPDPLGGMPLEAVAAPILKQMGLETALGVQLTDPETQTPAGMMIAGFATAHAWKPNETYFLQSDWRPGDAHVRASHAPAHR